MNFLNLSQTYTKYQTTSMHKLRDTEFVENLKVKMSQKCFNIKMLGK
jgi:hypothetical protein